MKKFWNVIVNCFSGLYSLLMDPCGFLCLFALLIVSGLCWFHRVGDTSFAAVAAIIPGIVAMLKHSAFRGSDIDQPPPAVSISIPPVNPAAPPPPNPQ